MPHITGQSIHAIHGQRESTALPWDRISKRSKAEYNAIAEHINTYHISPLQGLVRDALKLAQEGVGLQNVNEHHVWEECYNELEHEFGQLCDGKETVSQKEQVAQLQCENDALKALVQEYRVLAAEVNDASMVAYNSDGFNYVHMDIDWEEERNRLNEYAKELLTDAQKEKK